MPKAGKAAAKRKLEALVSPPALSPAAGLQMLPVQDQTMAEAFSRELLAAAPNELTRRLADAGFRVLVRSGELDRVLAEGVQKYGNVQVAAREWIKAFNPPKQDEDRARRELATIENLLKDASKTTDDIDRAIAAAKSKAAARSKRRKANEASDISGVGSLFNTPVPSIDKLREEDQKLKAELTELRRKSASLNESLASAPATPNRPVLASLSPGVSPISPEPAYAATPPPAAPVITTRSGRQINIGPPTPSTPKLNLRGLTPAKQLDL